MDKPADHTDPTAVMEVRYAIHLEVVSKGNTSQVVELAVLYDLEPPMLIIDITRSNHTTYIYIEVF